MDSSPTKKSADFHHHIICMENGSTMQLIATVEKPHLVVETVPYRTPRFWCVRFLVLVGLVTALQFAVLLLFPTLHQFLVQSLETPQPNVFFAVKTTQKFHASRLTLLLDTWIEQAKEQTFVFTDFNDESIKSRLQSDEHFVVTECAAGEHSRAALACKMARELQSYFDHQTTSAPRWFCHFDDDTYVNVPNLMSLLAKHDADADVYLGRPSIDKPMRLPMAPKTAFNFATGGAGFCLSASLMQKLKPYVVDGEFERISAKTRLPDDCTIGYIAEALLGARLIVVPSMHSHLEWLSMAVTEQNLAEQITFSYSKLIDRPKTTTYDNIVNVAKHPKFSGRTEDPTRLLSSHCKMFPDMKICQFD